MLQVFARAVGAVALLSLAACGGKPAGQVQAGQEVSRGGNAATGETQTPSTTQAEPVRLTDAELALLGRDERRTRIIEGFTCNGNNYGQTSFISYRPGGTGLAGNQEGEFVFSWKVRNDQLCYKGWYFEDECYDLPKRDMPNERQWLLDAMGKSCL